MKNMIICKLIKDDLKEITSSFGSGFTQAREYADRFTSINDAKFNLISVSNHNYAASIHLNYPEAQMALPIIDFLEKTYPLDFSYYQEIIDKANPIYAINNFFDEPLKIPFENSTWDQFKPAPRKRKLCDDFSRNIKIRHTSAGQRDSRMVLKHRLSIAKIKHANCTCEYVPVIKFTLPMSRMTNRTVIVSASQKHDFMFYQHSGKMIYLDRSEHDVFFEKHNKSLVTHIYNSLSKSIGMNDVALKDFKQLDDDERERFIMVSNMLKV
jgi:hypothetical protein